MPPRGNERGGVACFALSHSSTGNGWEGTRVTDGVSGGMPWSQPSEGAELVQSHDVIGGGKGVPEQQGRVASPTSTKLGMMGAMHCLCQDICNNDYTSLFLLTVFQQSRRSCVTSSQYINNQVVKQPIRHTRLLSNSHTHTHTQMTSMYFCSSENNWKKCSWTFG